MDCIQNTVDDDFMRRLRYKASAQRIPIFGSMELTHRCNLRCKHCYLGAQSAVWQHAPQTELDTATWMRLIDEVTAAGCLHLLLTGGDPLLRRDFIPIYQHAVASGLLVRIYTNGTLITDELLKIFQEYPPSEIEITLYGATAETYEKVTGVAGSYQKCLNGIERLLAIKAPVKLKTIVLTINQHEFFAIEQMAKNYGVAFRYDCMVQSHLDGDKTPLNFRITPEEVVAIDFASVERSANWQRQDKQYGGAAATDSLYNCGAARNMFHINAKGYLMPCITSVRYQYDLLHGSFTDAWDNYFAAILAQKVPSDFACAKCHNRFLCAFCPAAFYLENNSEVQRSQYLCDIGRLRRECIDKMTMK